MNDHDIQLKLTPVFRAVFDDENLILRPDLTAEDVDGWDSLSNLRLMLTIEKTFKVKFTASEIAKLKNVGDLEGLIRSKV
jgi:acyl carrier protein